MLQQVGVSDYPAVIAALEADGAVIVKDYLTADQLMSVRSDLSAAIADLPWCNSFDAYENEFFGAKTKRLHGVLQFGAEIERCLMHELPLTLGPQLRGCPVIMSTGELMAIGPDQTRQQLHRDGDSWVRAEFEQEILLSTNIALTEFRQDNGATVVVPGSHRWPRERTPQPDEIAFAEMAAGSALIYVGRVLHGGGENSTGETRMGLYFGYIPSWLRPLENPVQTHSSECLAGVAENTRKVLGLSEEGFIAYL